MAGIFGALGVPGLDGYRAALFDNQMRERTNIDALQGVLGLQQGILEQQLTPMKVEQLQLQLARQKQNAKMIEGIMGGVGGSAPTASQALAQGAAQGDIGPTVTNAERMQPSQSSQSGGIDLPPMIQAALLSGDPGLEKWANAQAAQYKPTDKIREAIALGMRPGSPQFNAYVGTVYNQGGAWQANPQGGVSLAPGYAQGQGAVKAEEAAATAPYQMGEYDLGGRKVKMSLADYKLLTEPPKSDADAFRAAQLADSLGIPFSIGRGKYPRFGESAAPAMSGARNPFLSSTESEKTYDSERSKEMAKQAQQFNESWQSGSTQRDNLNILETLLTNPRVSSGRLAEFNSDLKGIADSFGIKIAGKSEEDVIRALTAEMALKAKNQGATNLMPGAMSNFEQEILGRMVPNLKQSKEGRMILLQVMRAKLDRDMRVSEMAAEYETNNGRLDAGFYKQARDWLKYNPVFTPDKQKAMLELAKRLAK